MRSRLMLAMLLFACLPLLQGCTAATFGATSLAKEGDGIVVILRQCARESSDITLDEFDKDGSHRHTVGEWKPRSPVKASRTVKFALDTDPDSQRWITVKSFAGEQLRPGRNYQFWSSGPNDSGNAPGSVEAFTAADAERLTPGTVLDTKYEDRDVDVVTVIAKPLNAWTKDVDEQCSGNGWFS